MSRDHARHTRRDQLLAGLSRAPFHGDLRPARLAAAFGGFAVSMTMLDGEPP